jgi:cytochrome c peroxidase
MRSRPRWLVVGSAGCIAIGFVLLHFWPTDETQAVEATALPPMESNEPIQPIEAPAGLDPGKIDLGRRLFHDTRLSHNGQVSCSSCHDLTTGGTDRMARSIGIHGAVGIINAPTVLNSGFNFSQFWDGRAATLESQIDGPLESKIEMGSTWPEVMAKLKETPEYVRAFRQVYGDEIERGHVQDSIAEFERSLATPNSRFDRYLRHHMNALTSYELQGYRLFKSLGARVAIRG